MPAIQSLRMHEEVLLLALRNDKGTVAGGVMYQQAAGGAILAELILEGRLKTVTEGRSTYAAVMDRASTGDGILDECLRRVSEASRRAKLQTWVQRFGGVKQLKHRAAASLVEKGVLREEEDTVLLLFTRRIYPELDPAHERRIIERLERAVYSDTATVDPATTVLVALAHHAGLLKANLDRKRLKTRKERIKAITAGDAIGKATKQAIEAVQAAIFVAAITPAIIASSH
ncbi:MAG: GPP34 family phosphoprotein [Acidobacteria bacterium]|nr:GPP34 family phosphoprotein [Acidobacteriota bacterium]